MAEVIYRLPGKEMYSYAEVKFADGEPIDLELLKEALENLNATFPRATSQSSNGQSQGSVSGSQSRGEDIPSCEHGQRVIREGRSAKGPWKAYMCPERDRAQQCKPIDAKTGKPWG